MIATKEKSSNTENNLLEETRSWQKYLFFRPFYASKNLLDLCPTHKKGTKYTSRFSKNTTLMLENQVIDPKSFDLVLGFGCLESSQNAAKILDQLSSSKSTLILSVSKKYGEKKFKDQIEKHFSKRKIQYLYQENTWPALVKNKKPKDYSDIIAVIGDVELPKWPKLGISIPTYTGAKDLEQAFISMTKTYPGELLFAIAANSCSKENLAILDRLEKNFSDQVVVLKSKENLGYGRGANKGLKYLQDQAKVDYYVVSNDDVLAGMDCICLQVAAMEELEKLGHNPGTIGPVSGAVSGVQCVDIGKYSNLEELEEKVDDWHAANHQELFITKRIRGLFLLIHPKVLKEIGGFDPIFGIGNYEDDDHNARVHFAGYTQWIAKGAYLYHKGSQTFINMKVDYAKLMNTNGRIFNQKWRVEDMPLAFELNEKPKHIDLFIPLDAGPISKKYSFEMDGKEIDLVHEATDIEFLGYLMWKFQVDPTINREKILDIVESKAS